MEGGITTDTSYEANVSVPGLTEFHMIDLQTTKFLSLGPNSLTYLTVPRLMNATTINIFGGKKKTALEVSFPHLEYSALYFSGNVSE